MKNLRFNVMASLNSSQYIPLPRVVNGFYLKPEVLAESNDTFAIGWCITPTQSLKTFYFKSLEHAMKFAEKYVNNHGQKFWEKVWCKVLYDRNIVASCIPIQYYVNFNLD